MSGRRMLLEARLEMGSKVSPCQGDRSSRLIHPTEATTHRPGTAEGLYPHTVPKQARQLAVLSVCHPMALRGVPNPRLHGTHSCCMGAPGCVCLLWGSSQPAKALTTLTHTGINNLNTRIPKNFFHSLRPAYGLQCSSLKSSNIKTLRLLLGAEKSLSTQCHEAALCRAHWTNHPWSSSSGNLDQMAQEFCLSIGSKCQG